MLLEPVFDVFLLCVKFTPCRAFFMMYLCAASPSDMFSEIPHAVSKTKSCKFSPSNQFRIKGNEKKIREQGGTLAEGRAKGGREVGV